MPIGCIADDFTGASDIANAFTKGGLRTELLLGIPGQRARTEADVVVVALKSRSEPVDQAVSHSMQAFERLREMGCAQFVFKYCSTFDSTPQGNIGPVAEAMAAALGAEGVVVCPAFPATGRTVYQGHLFVHDRLLSESGMQSHPLTPMTDPDIRRWLALQTSGGVGHVPHGVVAKGAEALQQALKGGSSDHRFVVVDAICEDDLQAIGQACADAPLVTGGSGIGIGLAAAWRARGGFGGASEGFVGRNGPAVILAGSCSTATLGQIAHLAKQNPVFRVDPVELMGGADLVSAAIDFIRKHKDGAPLVASSSPPEDLKRAQNAYGAQALAAALERFFGEVAVRAVQGGCARLVVAGGETSGAVVSALGLSRLRVGPEIDPGVPALASGEPQLALVLKSGNFGGVDFFERALDMLAGKSA